MFFFWDLFRIVLCYNRMINILYDFFIFWLILVFILKGFGEVFIIYFIFLIICGINYFSYFYIFLKWWKNFFLLINYFFFICYFLLNIYYGVVIWLYWLELFFLCIYVWGFLYNGLIMFILVIGGLIIINLGFSVNYFV